MTKSFCITADINSALQFEGAVIPVNDTVCVINKQGNIRKKRNGLIKDIKPVSDAEMFLKVSND